MAVVGCARKASCSSTATATMEDLEENPTRRFEVDVLRLMFCAFRVVVASDEEVVKYIITNRDSLQLQLMHTSTLNNYDTYGLLWLFFAVGYGVGGEDGKQRS